MALTLPGGDVAGFEPSFVIDAFERLLRRLSVMKRFSGVSGFWKRELQKRGAIHYHLLLYGLEDDGLRAEFQAWMVAQWTSCFASGLTEEHREHHRWWHARAENMQLVQNFSGYFSKYVGKDIEATGGLPGRWWGSFNKRTLPLPPRSDAQPGEAAAVMLHRLARKSRQKKMDAGKHRAGRAQLEKLGSLNVTQAGLWRLRSGYDLSGHRNPTGARMLLVMYRINCQAVGFRPGKVRLRGKVPNTAPVVLCGASAPSFAAKALAFVNRFLGLSLELKAAPERQAFASGPLEPPTPAGPSPCNSPPPGFRGDFLDALPIVGKRPASVISADYDFPDARPRKSRKNSLRESGGGIRPGL